jgi:hypothetical protein
VIKKEDRTEKRGGTGKMPMKPFTPESQIIENRTIKSSTGGMRPATQVIKKEDRTEKMGGTGKMPMKPFTPASQKIENRTLKSSTGGMRPATQVVKKEEDRTVKVMGGSSSKMGGLNRMSR